MNIALLDEKADANYNSNSQRLVPCKPSWTSLKQVNNCLIKRQKADFDKCHKVKELIPLLTGDPIFISNNKNKRKRVIGKAVPLQWNLDITNRRGHSDSSCCSKRSL